MTDIDGIIVDMSQGDAAQLPPLHYAERNCLTAAEVAVRYGVPHGTVTKNCERGRFPGAFIHPRYHIWMIPAWGAEERWANGKRKAGRPRATPNTED